MQQSILLKIIIPLLLLALTSSCQNTPADCDKILNKVPYMARYGASEPINSDSLIQDVSILKNCGRFDSIDVELLQPQLLGVLMIKDITENKEVTYRSLLNRINEFKKTDDYPKIREVIVIAKKLAGKIASASEFEKDKELLKKIMTSEDLAAFKIFLEKNGSQTMTYRDAIARYNASKPKVQSSESAVLRFNTLVDLEQALKAGKAANKRIIIYFSGYAAVNCRKMESALLSTEKIKDMVTENFVYFSAMVDDKSPDPNDATSTIGKKYSKLQFEKFKSIGIGA